LQRQRPIPGCRQHRQDLPEIICGPVGGDAGEVGPRRSASSGHPPRPARSWTVGAKCDVLPDRCDDFARRARPVVIFSTWQTHPFNSPPIAVKVTAVPASRRASSPAYQCARRRRSSTWSVRLCAALASLPASCANAASVTSDQNNPLSLVSVKKRARYPWPVIPSL